MNAMTMKSKHVKTNGRFCKSKAPQRIVTNATSGILVKTGLPTDEAYGL